MTAARSAPPAVPPSAPDARALCRAISLQGDVHEVYEADGGIGPSLAVHSEIPESDWIALGAGTRLAVKDPRTSRETVFGGPGRARACVGGREESWLASGVFESEPGAAESPGAEEWVVTALGVLRFSAAKLRVEVAAARVTAQVGGGVVFAWIAPDVHTEGRGEGAGAHGGGAWDRVTDGAFRLSLGAGAAGQTPAGAARAAVDRCETIAHRAEELTRALLTPRAANDGGASAFEDVIVRQVSTRELARAACAVAEVRTGALAEDPASAKHDLQERLRSAAKAWTALPVAAAP